MSGNVRRFVRAPFSEESSYRKCDQQSDGNTNIRRVKPPNVCGHENGEQRQSANVEEQGFDCAGASANWNGHWKRLNDLVSSKLVGYPTKYLTPVPQLCASCTAEGKEDQFPHWSGVLEALIAILSQFYWRPCQRVGTE
jgi:hypothetical protein